MKRGPWRNSRKAGSNRIYNCTQSELIYMNVKLLGLRIYSYWPLKFNLSLP